MKIDRGLLNTCVRALTESMDVKTMTILAGRIFPGYNLNERTGFPSSFAVPNIDAAQQILADIIAENRFLDFAELLLDIQDVGIMGRRYPVNYLREIIKAVYEFGYVFDSEERMFLENPRVRITKNWGALKESTVYAFAFIRIDIVDNSRLVKKYSKDQIEEVYTDFRGMIESIIVKRNGRIWAWEGDGGLAAFHFGSRYSLACLTAVEILQELFFFNKLRNTLDDPIQVRMAVHGGECDYCSSNEEQQKSDPIRKAMDIEKNHAEIDSVTISHPAKVMLESLLSKYFPPTPNKKYYAYSFRWEEAT